MPQKTSKLAVVSLILFVLSLILYVAGFYFFNISSKPALGDIAYFIFIGGFFALVLLTSLIMAIISLFFIRKYKLKGKWYALVVIILALVQLWRNPFRI